MEGGRHMLLEAKNIFVSFKKENQTSFFGKEKQEDVYKRQKLYFDIKVYII